MKKTIFILVGIILGLGHCFAQKESISVDQVISWPYIGNVWINPNGKYVSYVVIKHLFSGMQEPKKSVQTLMIQSLDKQQEIIIDGVNSMKFSGDSRYAIFKKKDSLCILALKEDRKNYITDVQEYQLFADRDQDWLVYRMRGERKQLIIHNLRTGEQRTWDHVNDYRFNNENDILVLRRSVGQDREQVEWIELPEGKSQKIWSGYEASHLVFDEKSKQLAFLEENGQMGKRILCYTPIGNKLTELVTEHSSGIESGLQLGFPESFSKDGKRLFFQLQSTPLLTPVFDTVKLNIWTYMDARLLPDQLANNVGQKNFLSVVNLNKPNHVVRLLKKNEFLLDRLDKYILAGRSSGGDNEWYWNKGAIDSAWLIDLNDGTHNPVPVLANSNKINVSPDERYIIGTDPDYRFHDLYAYEIETKKIQNLTKKLPIPEHESIYDYPIDKENRGVGYDGYFSDGTVLLHDYYDLWKVDPRGRQRAVRITNGREKHWQYRLSNIYNKREEIFLQKEAIIITAFNNETKKSGFCQVKNAKSGQWSTLVLTLGDYHYNRRLGFLKPIKATEAQLYVLFRESAKESPNLFATYDFKYFDPVSHLYPERAVNWLTSELIKFRTESGILTRAILYKPENFDSSKNYPLILHYYNKKSKNLNQYPFVYGYHDDLDIAWFVSNGYLVCSTDIHFKIGETGESVRLAVEGAAKYLSKYPYVDSGRIGIQGHSFGGWATNYLITHSRMFSAAISFAGMSDLTSEYGDIWYGKSKQEYIELRRLGLPFTPWERPDLYVVNSPIYKVGAITTPVLLVHNPLDGAVDFSQSVEFFTGLRRAGKRVWMLEYENGSHTVSGSEAKDYLLRSKQFFDHYLKGSPAPKWMMQSISATKKNNYNDLELVKEKDRNGNWVTPNKEGLLIKN